MTALVALSLGHVLLPAAAGARPATGATTSLSEAAFSRVDVGGTRPDRTTQVRGDAGRIAATTAPAIDAELDAWGIPLAAGPGVATGAAGAPVLVSPAIVRFRPRDGWTDVDRNAQLSVRFTTAMDHATTEAAFHATLDGADLAGSLRWAEGDTVLVLRPSTALPYGARVDLRVEDGALRRRGRPSSKPRRRASRSRPDPSRGRARPLPRAVAGVGPSSGRSRSTSGRR